MAWVSTITSKGLELMQRWMTGDGALIVTGAKGGTDTVAAAQMYAQEAVSGTAHTLTLSDCQQATEASGTVLRATAKVYKERRYTGSAYTLKQIGLYAKLMNGTTQVVGETLIALYQIASGSGIDVPVSDSTVPELVHKLSMALRVGQSGTLSLTCDHPVVYVDDDQMDEVIGAQRAKKLRFVNPVYTTDHNTGDYHGLDYWVNPGTTWTAGRWYRTVTYFAHTFTAPEDMYACAIRAVGVRSDSVIMEAWIDTNGEYPAYPIEYETIDGGWIMLTCAQKPESDFSIGMIIMV